MGSAAGPGEARLSGSLGVSLLLRHGQPPLTGPFPGVMAIVNVTPDSFSDGGKFPTASSAIEEGLRAAALGAALLDVGGESTRPRGTAYGEGSSEVSEAEEERRVIPVVEGIRARDERAAISIDTRRASVAAMALDAGADLVNLVTGLDPDPALLGAVAARGAGIVLGHCRGTPQDTFSVSRFDDVVAEVAADLEAAREQAIAAGIPPGSILLDPGLGFGKNAGQNFALLGALDRLAPPGVPLVVGASRKAFLGSIAGLPPRERLPESLAAVAVAASVAARRPLLVRVHDAAETLRFLEVLRRSAPA